MKSHKIFLVAFITIGVLFFMFNEKYVEKKVKFVDGQVVYQIKDPPKLTSKCKLWVKGNFKCEVELIYPQSINRICIPKGEVNYWINLEWFSEDGEVVLRSRCQELDNGNNFIIGHSFSSGPFGKLTSSHKIHCEN